MLNPPRHGVLFSAQPAVLAGWSFMTSNDGKSASGGLGYGVASIVVAASGTGEPAGVGYTGGRGSFAAVLCTPSPSDTGSEPIHSAYSGEPSGALYPVSVRALGGVGVPAGGVGVPGVLEIVAVPLVVLDATAVSDPGVTSAAAEGVAAITSRGLSLDDRLDATR